MIETDDSGAYLTLRQANKIRGVEWSNGANDGHLFYAIELFGEAGELSNVVKKLERERMGMVGSRATLDDLRDELADYLICLDLLANSCGLRELQATRFVRGDISSTTLRTVSLGRSLGYVLANVEMLEASCLLGATDTHVMAACIELEKSLDNAAGYGLALAKDYDIDVREAVISKFNKTSEKYGLQTRLSNDARIL